MCVCIAIAWAVRCESGVSQSALVLREGIRIRRPGYLCIIYIIYYLELRLPSSSWSKRKDPRGLGDAGVTHLSTCHTCYNCYHRTLTMSVERGTFEEPAVMHP